MHCDLQSLQTGPEYQGHIWIKNTTLLHKGKVTKLLYPYILSKSKQGTKKISSKLYARHLFLRKQNRKCKNTRQGHLWLVTGWSTEYSFFLLLLKSVFFFAVRFIKLCMLHDSLHFICLVMTYTFEKSVMHNSSNYGPTTVLDI